MINWSMEQVDDNKYSFTFDGVRNTILCSLDRYDEFNRLSNELECLFHFKVVAAPFCASNKMYLADNEAHITVYTVENE